MNRGALLVLTLAAACTNGERQETPPSFSPGPVPSEFANGERLFNASCARCHGALAVGTSQGPPLVHRYYEPSHHADIAFRRAVALGVVQHHWRFGPMPRIEGVSETDVTAIVGYVRWLQRAAGIS